MSFGTPEEAAGRVIGLIKDFLDTPANTLADPADEQAFADPLTGFARGDDPLFPAYKEHAGPFHWTPLEIFKLTFPDSPAEAGDLSVISYVLPQTEATKADNRRETEHPSERWARARIFGEQVNVNLRRHLVGSLEKGGIEVVAPMLSPLWERKEGGPLVYASTWSERHIAHACGLGTFGLCDGLITPRGKAMRLGSVVARIDLPVTPRPYADHREYCLFYSKGACGKCIKRCPAGALSKAGHDKQKCHDYIRGVCREYITGNYGFKGFACGLCQTGVPCESGIPGV